jgi:inorganic pyrophosphatase
MANPWHDISLPTNAAGGTVPVVIEIPRGCKNKYELDKQTGLIRVDRVLFASMHYPANYGFIPRTLADDGDPLDVLVLGQEPIVPLAILVARVIGGFRMRDEEGLDDKIITVNVGDPAFADYQDTSELPRHVVAEMMKFFEDYKSLEGKATEVGDKLSREEALAALVRSMARYGEAFGG